jgi:methionyl-tRNA formyltransferase
LIKAIAFGYRWEGLALHQWAFTHTNLLAIVLPSNRFDEEVSGMVKNWARGFLVPLLCQPFRDDGNMFVNRLREYNPEIILCYCYTYKLSKEILGIPKYGCVNMHPGKLPEYAGRRPIEDAMKNNEKELWMSVHYMDEGFDTGKLIAERAVPNRENPYAMRSDLTKTGLRLLEENWAKIIKEKP